MLLFINMFGVVRCVLYFRMFVCFAFWCDCLLFAIRCVLLTTFVVVCVVICCFAIHVYVVCYVFVIYVGFLSCIFVNFTDGRFILLCLLFVVYFIFCMSF